MQFALISQSLVLPLIQSGKVRALAVNAAARTRSLPEVPTIAQAGYPDILMQSWYGIGAPAKTPVPVVEWLSQQFQRAGDARSARAAGSHRCGNPCAGCAARFTELIAVETRRWGALIHKRGIRL